MTSSEARLFSVASAAVFGGDWLDVQRKLYFPVSGVCDTLTPSRTLARFSFKMSTKAGQLQLHVKKAWFLEPLDTWAAILYSEEWQGSWAVVLVLSHHEQRS